MFQSHSHLLRHITTAHLAQTMSLLELNSLELRQKIEAELASNPALEVADARRCPTCRRTFSGQGRCPFCSQAAAGCASEPIVFVSPNSDFAPPSDRLSNERAEADDWTPAVEDLPTYVLRQIATELDPADRSIAAYILTSLDEDGLLRVPLAEVARYFHLPLQRVSAVQRLIQRAEPVGVGSETPQAALLAQIEVLSETGLVPPKAVEAIEKGMELLSRRAYPELGRLLGIPAAQAAGLARFICENLNPYPARAHWGEIHQGSSASPAYREPDILITKLSDQPDSPLVVEIISPFAGSLRLNPLFRQALVEAPADKLEHWQAALDGANLLVKCLQQRDHTLVRLMQRLVVLQRRYILEGDGSLLPLTRAQLADELNVHESTVSRAVSNKSILLPNKRIVPMAKFFDRSLHIRTALLEIIAQEQAPLSDTDIARLLVDQGFEVARRTVAKYRSMEGVLPARLRHSSSPAGTR